MDDNIKLVGAIKELRDTLSLLRKDLLEINSYNKEFLGVSRDLIELIKRTKNSVQP